MEGAAYCCVRCRKDERCYFTLGRNRHPQYNSLNNAACDLRTETPVSTEWDPIDTGIARSGFFALKNKQTKISHIKRNP